jgi:hypothetical protein
MLATGARLTSMVLLIVVATCGCDTRKRLEAPGGDTPIDTDQAPIHVRLFSGTGQHDTAIRAMRTTSDGGYVAVGYTGDSPWILKTNGQGRIEWQEVVGGIGESFGASRFNDVQLAPDGGYVAAGRLSDCAIVVKFRIDGTIEWNWVGIRPLPNQPDPPNYFQRRSAEAMAIAIKAGGGGYVVAGGLGVSVQNDRDRLVDGSWVMELTADGKGGRIEEFPDQPGFLLEGAAHGFMGPEGEGGIVEALASWPLTATSPVDGGFWIAGRSADGQMLVSRAQNATVPSRAPSVLWKRSFGTGIFHAMRVIERQLPDGAYEQHLLLLGETQEGMVVAELQAITGALLWAKQITGDVSIGQTRWSANSIQPTADGGFVLAAATERAPAVLKFDASGDIVWQYEYAPPQTGPDAGGGQATSIEVRADGGYRVAGYQTLWHTVYGTSNIGGFSFYHELATVFDLSASGEIIVNEKSGWSRIAISATVAEFDTEPFDPPGHFSDDADLVSSEDAGTSVGAAATDLVVETASGPSGVLPAPTVGSNDQGRTFFWGNAPGASGFILYRSDDGVTFTRDNTTRDYDFDLHGRGFVKIAAFNGTGYSEYSAILGPLGDTPPPPPPSSVTLTVHNSLNGGLVTSTPAGITCGTACTADFPFGADVTLTLIEGELLRFSSWTGCDSTAGRQCTLRMNRNTAVTVNYTEPP